MVTIPYGDLCLGQRSPDTFILVEEPLHDRSTLVSQGGGLEDAVFGQPECQLVLNMIPTVSEAEVARGKCHKPAAAKVTLHQAGIRVNNDLP
jgi:hypothetical protein